MIYECHGHIILDGVSYTGAIARHLNGPDEEFIRHNLKTCVRYSIGFYRDGGDKHGVSAFAKNIACEYGIDYRTPVYIIHKKGYYGGMFGMAFETMPEYRILVAGAKARGADFIKITASGLLDFANGGLVTGPAPAIGELCEMVNIAHGEGFSVMAHANGRDNIMRAVESGADSIEHGFYMDSVALRMMAQTGAVWVPTCATVAGLIGTGRYNDHVLTRILADHKAALSAACEIGVPIACGSDAGAAGVAQGAGTVSEVSILESSGVAPLPGNRIIQEVFKRK